MSRPQVALERLVSHHDTFSHQLDFRCGIDVIATGIGETIGGCLRSRMNRSEGIVRELGTALAVLGVFILTLLLPIHQAAGLQRDLAKIGFESAVSLSVCGPVSEGQSNDVPTAVKCPATGIAKHDFIGAAPPELVVPATAEAIAVRYAVNRDAAPSSRTLGVGQPRAPPLAG